MSGHRSIVREHAAILAADRMTWFAGLTAALTLTATRFHFATAEYRDITPRSAKDGLFALLAHRAHLERLSHWLAHSTAPVGDHLYWFLGSFLSFFVVPLLAALVIPGIHLIELGVGAGDWRYGVKALGLLYAVMLPCILAAAHFQTFAVAYPMCGSATDNWQALLLYEGSYVAYFVGWELVFRGLLCVALYPRIGAAAILLQTVTFGVMHGGKPEPEAFGAIIAGLALGVVAVRARSFWYGAALHSMVAVTMDAAAMTHLHRWPKVW